MNDAHRFNPYIAHGWRLCIIEPGRKGPGGKGWNTPERAVRAASEWPIGFGAGLCHAFSGTCAIDIDNFDVAADWLAANGINLQELILARDAVQISSGRQGRAKLLYTLPEPLQSIKRAKFEAPSLKDPTKTETYSAIDFRCATEEGLSVQDVLPPSVHPNTGRPYEWRYGDDLVGHWSMAPPIPEKLLALWRSELGAQHVTVDGPQAPKGAEFTEIRELLKHRDPDGAYEDWLEVGLALHHETKGSRDGLMLWNEWSMGGQKYKGVDDLAPHWASFRSDVANAITLGSLRRTAIASLSDFPIASAPIVPEGTMPLAPPAEDYGEDTRPDAVMQRVVGDHVVYVRTLDRYLDVRSREVYPTENALKNAFNPDVPLIVSPGRDGKPDRHHRPDPFKWLQNSAERRARDVRSVMMHPGEGPVFELNGVRYANGYKPPRPVEPLAPTQFERDAFRFVWSRMLDGRFAEWLLKFYAHALQKPGVKIQTAPLLVSETTGTGKSTIMAEIPKLLFGNVLQMTEADIRSPYNGQLMNTWWVTFEEVCAGNTKSERRYVTDKVKPWITNPEISVRPMFGPAFTMPNLLQFTGSSNHPDALQLDDENERRWGVCGVKEERYSPREETDVYQGFLLTPRAPGVLRWLFQNVDLTGFQPTGKAPITAAKRDMVELGRGTWETSIAERMESRGQPFDKDIFTTADVQTLVFGMKGGPSRVMLGRMLTKAPFSCVALSNHHGQRLYAWRNKAEWDACTQGERMGYLDTGVKPAGTWPDDPAVVEFASTVDHSDLV